MPIEMPPFSKIYKQREGVDKFFYDKLVEVVNVVNAVTEGESSKINITVLDDNDDGVAGARVTLTSGNSSFSTGETGSAGGASINNVPYGVYTVDLTVPEDYSLLASYSDVTVNSETTNVTLKVNSTVEGSAKPIGEE